MRCAFINCNKKLKPFSNYECKCLNFYCNIHRLPESHDCTFNYKNLDKKCELIENMKCIKDKVVKI